MSTVIVVVPRHVRATDAKYARAALEQAGYACLLGPSPLRGYVLVEFEVGLRPGERPVVEAFEIEVDDLLRASRAPFGRGASGLLSFGGSGARVEVR